MALRLGFCSSELQLDPELVNRVVGWLEQEQPTGPVPLELATRAAATQPLAQHGTNQHSEVEEGDVRSEPPVSRGETQAYLLRRLARDAPEILERVKAGEFRSARAAAIEAGIVKPAPTIRLVDDPTRELLRQLDTPE